MHHRLSNVGVRKRLGEDYDPEQAAEVLDELVGRLDRELP